MALTRVTLRSTDRRECVLVESLEYDHLLDIAKEIGARLDCVDATGAHGPGIRVVFTDADGIGHQEVWAQVGDYVFRQSNASGMERPWRIPAEQVGAEKSWDVEHPAGGGTPATGCPACGAIGPHPFCDGTGPT